ncbi:unnamed protein product, partial [Rotaria sp. Silwood2]
EAANSLIYSETTIIKPKKKQNKTSLSSGYGDTSFYILEFRDVLKANWIILQKYILSNQYNLLVKLNLRFKL